MELTLNTKDLVQDQEITGDVKSEDLSKKDFKRIYAKGRTFTQVSFVQSVFSECYLRNCRFIRCDFTGCSFKSTNLRGSQFDGCVFRYTSWDRTTVDEEILSNGLPNEENLARDLVRALRVNFAQIGNYDAVNTAASIEVRLAGVHLKKAAFSRESYYRAKYKGWRRLEMLLGYVKWRGLDLLWGNGESLSKIAASALLVIVFGVVVSRYSAGDLSLKENVLRVLSVFWGVPGSPWLGALLGNFLVAARLLLFGLFMAILVKRLSRR